MRGAFNNGIVRVPPELFSRPLPTSPAVAERKRDNFYDGGARVHKEHVGHARSVYANEYVNLVREVAGSEGGGRG